MTTTSSVETPLFWDVEDAWPLGLDGAGTFADWMRDRRAETRPMIWAVMSQRIQDITSIRVSAETLSKWYRILERVK